jgi:hypothetical protein
MSQRDLSSVAVQQSIWKALPLNPEQRLSLLEIMKEQALEQKADAHANGNLQKEDRASKIP